MQPSKVRVRLAIPGLALTFALGLGTHPAAEAQAPPSSAAKGPAVIFQKARSFRIPFQIDPAELARRRELQLWSSDDQGRHWKQKGVTTPDQPAFTFNAEQDGEFWLAVRTVDSQGRLFPADEVRIEPSMRIVVDTTPPSLVLEPRVRSASLASVRWEVRDDHPDPHPPVLEYQVEGQKEWHPVPVETTGEPGVATWDSGFAQPLIIRATALDLAGNKSEKILRLGSSRPGQSTVTASVPESVPTAKPPLPQASAPTADPAMLAASQGGLAPRPPSSQVTPAPGLVQGLPGARDARDNLPEAVAAIQPSAQDVAQQATAPTPIPAPLAIAPQADAVSRAGGAPFATQMAIAPIPPAGARSRPGAMEPAAPTGERDSVQGPGQGGDLEKAIALLKAPSAPSPSNGGADPNVEIAAMMKPAETVSPSPPSAPSEPHKLKVPSPRFLLDYAVDRAGPDGRPAVVEIWVTGDGGKTWIKQGNDPDRVSPVLVDLRTGGTFGLSLIARDADGLGDKPPAPGDVPKLWIEVETQASAQPLPLPPPPPSSRPSLLQRALRR